MPQEQELHDNQDDNTQVDVVASKELSTKDKILERITAYEKENLESEKSVSEQEVKDDINEKDNTIVDVDVQSQKNDIPAPHYWAKEKAKDFAKIPEHLREYILQKERESSVAIGKDSEIKHVGKRIIETLQDYGLEFKPENADVIVNDFKAYKRAEKILNSPNMLERSMFIARLIDHYKVDMNVLNQDPSVLQYAHQNITLAQQQEQDRIQNEKRIREYEEKLGQYSQAENMRLIEDFKKTAPDLDIVAQEVSNLLRLPEYEQLVHEDPRSALEKAYNVAIYMNESTRQKVIDNKLREAESKRVLDAKSRVSNARNYASSVKSGSGTSNLNVEDNKNPRQKLRERISQMTNGG